MKGILLKPFAILSVHACCRPSRPDALHCKPADTDEYRPQCLLQAIAPRRSSLRPRPLRNQTNQGLTLLAINWLQEKFHAYRADIEGNFLRTLEQVPQLAERVQAARREERFL